MDKYGVVSNVINVKYQDKSNSNYVVITPIPNSNVLREKKRATSKVVLRKYLLPNKHLKNSSLPIENRKYNMARKTW